MHWRRALFLGIFLAMLLSPNAGDVGAAQDLPVDLIEILIVRSREALTIIIPGNRQISLEELAFEVVRDGQTEIFHLAQYGAFQPIAHALQAPVCLRLKVRDAAIGWFDPPCLSEVSSANRHEHIVEAGNNFWYDEAGAQIPLLVILRGNVDVGRCPANQGACTISLPQATSLPPLSTPTLTPTPTSASTLSLIIVIQIFSSPAEHANGVTWAEGNLWITDNSSTISRVDTNGQLLDSFFAPDATPEGITYDGDNFWVFTTNMSEIYQFGIEDGVVVHGTIPSPNQRIGGGLMDDLGWHDESLWYADTNILYELNTSGEVLSRITFARPITGFDWVGNHLWVAFREASGETSLNRVNIDGEISLTQLMPFQISSLAWGGNYLWAVHEGMIYQLDISEAMIGITTATSNTNESTSGSNACVPISFGDDPLAQSLSLPTQQHCFTFYGDGQTKLRLTTVVTSGELVMEKGIEDANGNTLCSSTITDNHVVCELPQSGNHTIYAADYWGTGTGEYNIHLQRLNFPVGCTPISFGNTLSGSLTVPAEEDCYTFSAAAGTRIHVLVAATSGDLNPAESVYDETGVFLCDSPITSNELECQVTTSGNHTIFIADYWGAGTGSYSVSLR